jgi:hypothetical protein
MLTEVRYTDRSWYVEVRLLCNSKLESEDLNNRPDRCSDRRYQK